MSETTIDRQTPHPKTVRARIRRHPERGVPERVEEILAAGHVAHVAYTVDGEPRVIPFLYHYEAGRIVLHGHAASQTLARLRKGVPVAVSVTLVDGLVASRDAENHSTNYRSVVAYGTTRRVTDIAQKRRLLEAMTARYFPGRTVGRDYAAATEEQLLALEVVEVLVDEAAAKARTGGPTGPRDADPGASGTLGVFDLDGVTRLD